MAVFGVANAVLGELVHAAVVLRQSGSPGGANDEGAAAVGAPDLVRWCQGKLAQYKVWIR